MKQLIILVGALVLSASSFAGIQANGTSQSKMNTLGLAFKNQIVTHPHINKNDITMVYGGADVSNKPTLTQSIATA